MGSLSGAARMRGAFCGGFLQSVLAMAVLSGGLALSPYAALAQTQDVASASDAPDAAISGAAAPSDTAPSTPRRGSQTGLAIPRFVSLKSSTVNARRGPSLSHQVDWVFVRRGLPVEVVAEHGNWRKVRDHDGASGWVHHSLIRGARSAIIVSPETMLMRKPSPYARPVARAERGVVASIEECVPAWCEIEADGFEGWARKTALWGVRADEVFD